MSIGAKKKRTGDFAARCMDVDVDVHAGRDRARNVYTLYDDSVARRLLGDRSKRRAKSRGVLAGVTVLGSFGSICRLLYSYRLNEKVTRHLPPPLNIYPRTSCPRNYTRGSRTSAPVRVKIYAYKVKLLLESELGLGDSRVWGLTLVRASVKV